MWVRVARSRVGFVVHLRLACLAPIRKRFDSLTMRPLGVRGAKSSSSECRPINAGGVPDLHVAGTGGRDERR